MVIRHSVNESLAKNSVTRPMKYIVANYNFCNDSVIIKAITIIMTIKCIVDKNLHNTHKKVTSGIWRKMS